MKNKNARSVNLMDEHMEDDDESGLRTALTKLLDHHKSSNATYPIQSECDFCPLRDECFNVYNDIQK